MPARNWIKEDHCLESSVERSAYSPPSAVRCVSSALCRVRRWRPSAPCSPSSKAFAEFGDTNDYYLAPGGAFETLTWAKVGNVELSLDNDPFELFPGVRSARLDNGESVSTSFCVDRTMPHLRFVARRSSGQPRRHRQAPSTAAAPTSRRAPSPTTTTRRGARRPTSR